MSALTPLPAGRAYTALPLLPYCTVDQRHPSSPRAPRADVMDDVAVTPSVTNTITPPPDATLAHSLGLLLPALTHDAVLVIKQGEAVFHNAAARRLLQLPDGEPPSQEILAPLAALAAAAPAGSTDTPAMLLRHGGTPFQVRVRWDALARTDTHLFVIADISGLAHTRHALEASNRELKAMARRLFRAQEDERRAISRDLHDDIGQTITAMRMSAHAAMEENQPERRRGDLQHLLMLADQAVARLRDLSMLLRPPQLDVLGLASALRWQAELILKNTGIVLDLDVPPLDQRLPAETEQACFRIAQEALTNIVRHAQASHVRLSLHHTDDDLLRLTVADNGTGFSPGQQTGLGLVVMRERAQTAGGTLQLTSLPSDGTLILCTLPCTPPE